MPENWNEPTTNSQYIDVLARLKGRDVDAATMFKDAPSNQPTGTIRYERSTNKLQEWNGAAWVDLVLALAGGGTGAVTAAAARTALGIGTIGTQDSNNVNITGGSIRASLNADDLLAGTVPLARISGLVDAQIAVGAAIAWAKISKSGSSLADLATRSATDLNSGTLNDARLSSNVPLKNAANTFTLQQRHSVGPRLDDNSIGSGTTNFLVGNNPAIDPSAPYIWLKFTSQDGSLVYVPAWK